MIDIKVKGARTKSTPNGSRSIEIQDGPSRSKTA